MTPFAAAGDPELETPHEWPGTPAIWFDWTQGGGGGGSLALALLTVRVEVHVTERYYIWRG